jgi:HD superfamily phosphodiesterase
MTGRERLQRYLKIERINRIYTRAEKAFREKRLLGHGWDHILRDIINAVVIGEEEKADMDVVMPAVILHDIGFLYDPDPSRHPEIGAERCGEWLTDWSAEQRNQIADCIRVHKGKMREFTLEPETLEEQVVCDADMLEKAGWLGVLQAVRVFSEFAAAGKPEFYDLHNVAAVLATVKSVKFYTATGKRLATERGDYMRAEVSEKVLQELEFYR